MRTKTFVGMLLNYATLLNNRTNKGLLRYLLFIGKGEVESSILSGSTIKQIISMTYG